MTFWFGKNKNNGEIKPTRPWGDFEILGKVDNTVIKRITVRPLKRLSYQSHNKRAEHWFIIQGLGKVTLNDTAKDITTGESINIPTLSKHRIENASPKEDLIFIEISTGVFDENDIVRYEDDFGRK
jgi:mannose-6-phosphate isomerase